MTPTSVDKNAAEGGSTSPVRGSVMKTQEYQTPSENWGIPAMESQTMFNDAKIATKARKRLLVRFGFI
ncbi:MAG: hypothetical protein OEZ24_06240 [Candidatus Bathyarchaeota archaeon]|nr:hypothetical protein [Candidatus Bathyarchaeota archaeon]